VDLEHESESKALPSDAPVTTSDTKKPSKKRKFDDSPPWKSATTQTPTAFIIDGRRKSGRTNPLPPELFSPTLSDNRTSTRERRATQRQVVQPTPSTRQITTPLSSIKQTNGKAKYQSPVRVSTRRSNSRPSPTYPASLKKSTYVPASTKSKTTSKTTPTKNSSLKFKPSPTIGTRKSARALKKAVAAAEEELAGSKRHLDETYANGHSDEASSFESDGAFEGDEPIKLPKVKVKVKFGVPKPVITHPTQIPLAKQFQSFEEFLYQDDPEYHGSILLEAEASAQEEALIRNKIEHEARQGVLTVENCSLFLTEKPVEPDQQYGHYDHLLAHALHLRKLMMKERKEHQELMRKRNAAVMAEVRRRRPRTKEEIEQEQHTENRKLYKEQISQLRRKWDEVTKVSANHCLDILY
jgi:helicase SWR1